MNWSDLLSSKRLRKSNRVPENESTKDTVHTEDIRNPFESDFGRVIFSPATRRMHDKTQVFPLTADDNTHSRLTHSMEVMAIGYSLGVKVCQDKDFQQRTGKTELELLREIPIILQNACLVHDIGNPPFGHFGETVIQNYFKNFFKEVEEKRTELKKQLSDAATEEEKSLLESQESKLISLKKLEQEAFTNFDGNAQGFRVCKSFLF